MNVDIFIGILIGIAVSASLLIAFLIARQIWNDQQDRIADVEKRVKNIEKIAQIKSVTIEDDK
jgi:uncharacterized membrane protein YciS (DUF1049 family)